jgi:hypothetical protein
MGREPAGHPAGEWAAYRPGIRLANRPGIRLADPAVAITGLAR